MDTYILRKPLHVVSEHGIKALPAGTRITRDPRERPNMGMVYIQAGEDTYRVFLFNLEAAAGRPTQQPQAEPVPAASA